MSGSIVSAGQRARVRALAEPIARGFGRLGLTPNHLTFIGFGIAVGAGIAAAQQAWLAAGILVLSGGVFDLFDGALARATGRVSRIGAFYDSVFDRWGEGVVYVGIAWGSVDVGFGAGAVLATAALASAVMVSYARAKSESLGFTRGSRMASVGLMPREVRLAVLTLGLVLAPTLLYEALPPGYACGGPCDLQGGTLTLALVAITIGATITTIQRILHVRAQAREADGALPPPS
ncbi:MAG: CDP-alcohol phosphatidyltransferase family protein [Chloroflexota bacterium]